MKNQVLLYRCKHFTLTLSHNFTTKSNIFEELNKGNNVIFDIDWQGTNQIISQKLKNKLLTFFILPPSREELFKRLSNRDMKDKLIAEERMKQFDKDVLH